MTLFSNGTDPELQLLLKEGWSASTEETELEPRSTTAVLSRIRKEILPKHQENGGRRGFWKKLFFGVAAAGLLLLWIFH